MERLPLHGRYTVECVAPDGTVRWREVIDNLITDAGKRLVLDTILGNTAAGVVRFGLKGTGTAAAADTQASHAGWSEVGGANAPTSSSGRLTPTWNAASGTSKSTSAAASFAMTGAGTVDGAFVNIGGSATVDNTTGTLFSVGSFSGGAKTVANLDTVNVTYTLSA